MGSIWFNYHLFWDESSSNVRFWGPAVDEAFEASVRASSQQAPGLGGPLASSGVTTNE